MQFKVTPAREMCAEEIHAELLQLLAEGTLIRLVRLSEDHWHVVRIRETPRRNGESLELLGAREAQLFLEGIQLGTTRGRNFTARYM